MGFLSLIATHSNLNLFLLACFKLLCFYTRPIPLLLIPYLVGESIFSSAMANGNYAKGLLPCYA